MTNRHVPGQEIKPPTALYWAVAFDLFHILAGLGLLYALFASSRTAAGGHDVWSDPALQMVAIGLPVLVAGFALVMLSLRRARSAAWIAQLVLICLVVGLTSIPGLLWIPLLIAWCSTPVRDWFDPPSHRHFS